MRYGFGVDLGGTSVKLAFFDETGTQLRAWAIPTVKDNGGRQILPDIAGAVLGYLEEKGIARESILGIGIGVPGPVDGNGVVSSCVNLGWDRVEIARELTALTGIPVAAANDANVAAMGEFWKGGGTGSRNVIFVTLGTGVGGGIVLDGRLVHGIHGAGGEIGHMNLNPFETDVCNCGNCGCAEQYCSATGIVRLAKKHLAADDTASCLRALEKIECKDIFAAGRAGDGAAQAILEQYYDYLGRMLGVLGSILDPEIIVLGGGVSKAGKQLLEGVEPYFKKYVFTGAVDVELAIATLGNDAGAYGAFKLALDAFG